MCDWAVWTGRLDRWEIETLGHLIWEGNPHATGVALHLGYKVLIHKSPVTAPVFFQSRHWRRFFYRHHRKMVGGLLHTRFATNGSPENNLNNHPHISVRTGSVLVHKGMVRPWYHYPSISDCDSEQLLHALDQKGLVQGILDCPGSAAVAYISGIQRDRIWLYTNGTPITVLEWRGRKVFSTALEGTALPLGQWFSISLDDGGIELGPKVTGIIVLKEVPDVCLPHLWYGLRG